MTDKYAKDHNIVFSTHVEPSKSKSKCLWFTGHSEEREYPAPMLLDGKELPWVTTAPHWGHELSQDFNMEHSAWCFRAKFINNSMSVQTF